MNNLKRVLTLVCLGIVWMAALPSSVPAPRQNIPQMVEANGRLRLDFTPERLVVPRGLQPSLLVTSNGTLVVQAQIPEKPFPTARMVYPWAMETVTS